MKQTKTLVAGLAICATFWTACNKASYHVAPDSSTPAFAAARVMENNGMLTAGYVNAPYILVRGKGTVLAEFSGPRTWDLYELLANTGLPLQPGKYPDLETILEIAPRDGQPALLLNGSWTSVDEAGNTGGVIPITFRIDVPLRLIATPRLMVLTEDNNLLSLLNINPDKLTGTIQQDLWQRAVDPATNTIEISDRMNPDLYQSILRNLGEMVQVFPAGNPEPASNAEKAVNVQDAATPPRLQQRF